MTLIQGTIKIKIHLLNLNKGVPHFNTERGISSGGFVGFRQGAGREGERLEMHEHSEGDQHIHSHGHSHKHVHSQEEKKAVMNRLSKAIGHLEAVKRMVEKDADCSEVLIQLAAVRSAINNTGKVVLKNHIDHCIVEAVEENDQEAIRKLNQAIDKFIK